MILLLLLALLVVIGVAVAARRLDPIAGLVAAIIAVLVYFVITNRLPG